jgi:CubicO group peptidase (beta-lactamase class C family)
MQMRQREFVGAAVAGAVVGGMGLGLTQGATAAKTKLGGNIHPLGKEFLAKLPKLMEIAQLPGVGIGVVQGGKLAWTHYEGFANAQEKTPITAESIFPAASLSKQVFAYLALGLADEGKLR